MTRWNVVLSYDVQKYFTVKADSEEEAYEKAYAWNYVDVDEDWELRDHIETTEMEEYPSVNNKGRFFIGIGEEDE